MAPETFHGVAADKTIDIFSLGVVLYELLTGKSPFQRGSDLETIAALQRAIVPRPSELRPDLDPALDAIVLRAMARDRAERYPGAAPLEHDLREWARRRVVPHDARAVGAWLLDTFPERLNARRALLARIADPGDITVVEGPPLSALDGGTPVSGPISAASARHAAATPLSGRISIGTSSPRVTPSVRGGTQIIPGSNSTAPPGANPTTAFGIARSAGMSSASQIVVPELRRQRRWMPVVGGLIGGMLGIGGVVLLMRPPPITTPEPSPGLATAAPAPPAPAPATATPSATVTAPPADTPSADAAPPAKSAEPKRPTATQPKKPAEAKPPTKGKGILVRNYE